MRQFIRHPSDIPITVENKSGSQADTLSDIGYGGLCFFSTKPLLTGSVIKIRIDLVAPACEVDARVVWNKPHNSRFEVGVSFIGQEEAYKVRMVEQICHIEHYKKAILAVEGRELSSREAALEWIKRYAHQFPAQDLQQQAN